MKAALTAILLTCLAGCTTGEAFFTVSGVPGSSTMLKQKTVTTMTEPNANVMSKNLEQSLIKELQRSHYKYKPKDAEIVIKVRAGHDGRGTGDSWSYAPIWGGIQTNTEHFELINLDFQALEKGKPFWEARISGAGDVVLSDLQGGCIRELLLNHTDNSDSREDRCYKDFWPPR